MRASEAIAILEALDPSLEVTLTIGVRKVSKPIEYNPAYTFIQGSTPVLPVQSWPPRKNEITCKLH